MLACSLGLHSQTESGNSNQTTARQDAGGRWLCQGLHPGPRALPHPCPHLPGSQGAEHWIWEGGRESGHTGKRNDRNLPASEVQKGRHTPSFCCNKSGALRRRSKKEALPPCLLGPGIEELTEQTQGSWPQPQAKGNSPTKVSWEKQGKVVDSSPNPTVSAGIPSAKHYSSFVK